MKNALIIMAWATVIALMIAGACLAELLPGTVLVSRNADERQNTSPGYWNHLAMYVGNDTIVEAQVGRGVIRTPMSEYLARPYSRILAMEPRDPAVGQRAAAKAQTLVGLPFKKFASALPGDRLAEVRGMNCDNVVRDSLRSATGDRRLRKLKIPDRILLYD